MICLKCYKFNDDKATKCINCGNDLPKPDNTTTKIEIRSFFIKSHIQRVAPVKLFPMKLQETALSYFFFFGAGLFVKLPLIQFGEGKDYAPLLLWYLGSFSMIVFITPIIPILFVLFIHVLMSLILGKITFWLYVKFKIKVLERLKNVNKLE